MFASLVAGLAMSAVRPHRAAPRTHSSGLVVSHVVVIVQENRSFDDLFNGYPGANTVTVDPYTGTPLVPVSIAAASVFSHRHTAFVTDCAASAGSSACAMTGFLQASTPSCGCSPYQYVPSNESAPYFSLAQQGELLDDMFQCNSGPSFSAHQCLIAGQDGGFLSNGSVNASSPWAWDEDGVNPSCANPTGASTQVNVTSAYPGTEGKGLFCSTYATIFDEAAAAGLSWRYYSNVRTAGLWCGPCNVLQDWQSSSLVAPDWRFFSDLSSGLLANVTYIIPQWQWSDHAQSGKSRAYWAGTDWVGNIVNAIEASPFASSTEILVTWDDWGGYYDHVVPPIWQPNSYGFRVPGVIIGPGVIPNQVDHTEHNQASFVLGTIEYLLGLPSLNQEDSQMAPFENFDFVNYPGAPAYAPVPVHSPSSWYSKPKGERFPLDDAEG